MVTRSHTKACKHTMMNRLCCSILSKAFLYSGYEGSITYGTRNDINQNTICYYNELKEKVINDVYEIIVVA